MYVFIRGLVRDQLLNFKKSLVNSKAAICTLSHFYVFQLNIRLILNYLVINADFLFHVSCLFNLLNIFGKCYVCLLYFSLLVISVVYLSATDATEE